MPASLILEAERTGGGGRETVDGTGLNLSHLCDERRLSGRPAGGHTNKKSAAHAGLRTCVLLRRGRRIAQWRSALRERLASASSLSSSMWAWATMTSMVENMSDSSWDRIRGLYPCLTRPGIARRISNVECAAADRVGATLRVPNKKSARRAWQLCQALDGYSLFLRPGRNQPCGQ